MKRRGVILCEDCRAFEGDGESVGDGLCFRDGPKLTERTGDDWFCLRAVPVVAGECVTCFHYLDAEPEGLDDPGFGWCQFDPRREQVGPRHTCSKWWPSDE